MPRPRLARPFAARRALAAALVGGGSLGSITAQDATFFRDAKARDLVDRARVAIFGGPDRTK